MSALPASAALAARMPLVDALKALASQVIVLHHLAIYGPLSDLARPWAGPAIDALDTYGRYAVQVFLVIAGFLAARSFAPDGRSRVHAPLPLIGRRWVRLAGPYIVAIIVSVVVAGFARGLATHASIPEAPTPAQFIANLAMLQDVLGEEALSAGAWYVAIDLQLYALFALMMALAARSNARGIAQALVVTATVASLLAFNRDPAWDVWAPYYFGSYGLGVLAAWSAQAPRPRVAAIAIAVLGVLALWVEFRSRIALATTVALLLAWTDVNGLLRRWPESRLIGWLGRISFSVFLIHYPVVVLFDAIAARWLGGQPLVEALTLGLAFISCTAAGALFHRYVETPLAPRSAPRRAPMPADPHDAGQPTRPMEVPRG